MPTSRIQLIADQAEARATLRVLRGLPRDLRREVAKTLRQRARVAMREAKAILRNQTTAPRSRSGYTARSLRVRSRYGGMLILVESQEHPQKGPVARFLETETEAGGRRVTVTSTRLGRDRRGRSIFERTRRSTRIGGAARKPAYPFLTKAQEEGAKETDRAVRATAEKVLNEAARRGELA